MKEEFPLDIILVTGDAYVDHPSFGVAVIRRVLENAGFKVGVIAQPDWHSADDFKKFGQPRLFFGITGGNADSMVANYTANKKKRSDDKYSPGDKAGKRPDRAAIVYANRVREAFKDAPIILGGLEASMRRLAHYDYWDNRVRHSILVDSRADMLVYGMGERQIVEVARLLDSGKKISELDDIRGTAFIRSNIHTEGAVVVPTFEEVSSDLDKFNKAFVLAYGQMDPFSAKRVVQKDGARFIVQNPPAMPFSSDELDRIYELPYTRKWDPAYDKLGGVKALETVRTSLTTHRGCVGECSFCSLFFHQGRIVQSRSVDSIVREAERIASDSFFKGTITDVGGPTANMFAFECANWGKKGSCGNKKCLVPQKCANLKTGYDKCIELYRRLRKIKSVKHVFIGSGFRHDLLADDDARKYLDEICAHHISGLIKVAPEHCSNNVLDLMNKPRFEVYEKFVKTFQEAVKRQKKKSFIVNYFISAHPGSSLTEAMKLGLYLAKRRVEPEQIQDFIPLPGTRSGAMYYTEKDPFTGKKVYVAKDDRERKIQRAFLQYNKPGNTNLIREGLRKIGQTHVIGKFLKDHR